MNSLARRPSVRQRLALFREAVRGIWQGPIYSSDPNLREFFGSHLTATGVSVTEGTALTYAAVWSAMNCISGDVAALPLHMFKRAKDGGKDKFLGNPTGDSGACPVVGQWLLGDRARWLRACYPTLADYPGSGDAVPPRER